MSFDYRTSFAGANGELRDPSALVNNVRLDRSGQLQCTSCHDPHNNQYGTFLVMANTASALCVQCHKPNQWVGSAHATSTAVWNGTGANPWPHTGGTTVAANGCENCHRPHAAGSPKRLLNFTPEEQNCLVCHSGTVATKDIASELNKVSVHPVLQTSGIHDAAELALSTSRHVTCVDCHNPHATKASASPALEVSGSLASVRGINAAGAVVPAISFEYELCFRCHGDSEGNSGTVWVPAPVSADQPPAGSSIPAPPPSIPSKSLARTPVVPSLILPLSAASLVACDDCHNNDQGPVTGGTGPNGPHGSSYAPLLEKMLLLTDSTPYNREQLRPLLQMPQQHGGGQRVGHQLVLASDAPRELPRRLHHLPRFPRGQQLRAPHQFQHHLRPALQRRDPIYFHRPQPRHLHAHLPRRQRPAHHPQCRELLKVYPTETCCHHRHKLNSRTLYE